METITNAASSVVNTASNLIYGQPAKDTKDTEVTTTTAGNETGGKEPVSGQQGKGTVNDPFDQGNAENPVDATSKTNTVSDSIKDTTSTTGNTSYKQDDFLKLSPALGKPSTTESSTGTSASPSTSTTGETSIPIVPLNPDVATSGTGKTDTTASSATGITDKAGVTDKVWKPTSLDDVEPAGAPGAGPSAPEYTPATPDMGSSTSHKASEPAVKEVAKDTTHTTPTTHTEPTHSSSGPSKGSVGGDIDAILESTPKSKHTVDDKEADDPHSKMSGKTVRQTEASHHGESGNSKSLASEKAGASHTSADATSPTGEEKSGKMSQLKDKLKDKLHIGSKDK